MKTQNQKKADKARRKKAKTKENAIKGNVYKRKPKKFNHNRTTQQIKAELTPEEEKYAPVKNLSTKTITNKIKHDFIIRMRENGGFPRLAAEEVGISYNRMLTARKNDVMFDLAWREVMEATGEVLENAAFQRAVNGVDEPVFHQGTVVGHVKKYSDNLLTTLLKANKPEKYNTQKSEVSIEGEINLKTSARQKTDKELQDLIMKTLGHGKYGKGPIIDAEAHLVDEEDDDGENFDDRKLLEEQDDEET